MKKSEKLAKIHDEAIISFDRIQDAMYNERQQCVLDRRFYSIAGAQWEGSLQQQFENKPRFEVNKVHLSVIRIINEYRNNKTTVRFVSRNGEMSDKLADTCASLFRADEQDSNAEEAYDNAFEEAVGGGFGAYRLYTEYEDEFDPDNDKQRIRFDSIPDADTSVFWDIDAKRFDKSDARECFVIYSLSHSEYERRYGDYGTPWPKEITTTQQFDWATPDVVYISEYYRVEEISWKKYIYETATGDEECYYDEDFEKDPTLADKLDAVGTTLVTVRKIKRRRVHKYILDGNQVLEDLGYIAGPNIPIVPVYGKRWFIDNIERCMGQVRLSKDPQRLKNMQTSKLAEISSLSSVEKPIFYPEQIAGHENNWAQDNIANFAYQVINQIYDSAGNIVPMAGPVGYTRVPNIPQPLAALIQLCDADLSDILGKQEQGEEMVDRVSGRALEMIQNRLDMLSYIFISNFGKSTKRCGEIWLGMAKETYVENERKMKSVGKQGNVSSVEIMRPNIDPEDGKIYYENDLSKADYNVVAEVGPSSVSKRNAVVRSMLDLLAITQDQETATVLTSMVIMHMDGEGIEDIRNYFRQKLIRMGVVKPDEQEAKVLEQELQNQKPDPNTQYLMAAAQKEQAIAQKVESEIALNAAKVGETKAKTIETLSNIGKS